MQLKPIVVGCGVLLVAVTLSADDPKSLLWQDTGPFKHVDDSPAHRFSQQLLLHHRNRLRIASAPSALSADVGDVSVLVDNGAIVFPAAPQNPFDLSLPTSIVWMPTAGGFAVSFGAASLDPNVGSVLPLTDDDTERVTLPFSFPLFGSNYADIFVNSDGNITLGAGDAESALRDSARLIGGPPRIAPLLDDLNPEGGGSVSARVAADRVVVTWTDVPEFGVTNANTFQATLHANGTIVFVYSRIESQFGSPSGGRPSMVIGVAEGGDEGPFNQVDLTANLPATLEAGAIFEEFSTAHGTLVDTQELSREFYRTHGDKYDFLVVFTDFAVDLGDAFAFNQPIRNDTLGLSDFGHFDFSDGFGSESELESFVMMGNIGVYWPDERKLVDPPIRMFRFLGRFFGPDVLTPPFLVPPPQGPHPISRRARWFGTSEGFGSFTLGLNSAMSVMGQEVGHRWMAYAPFVHPTKGIGPDSFDLLGRAFSHWSFFFNVRVPQIQFGGDPRASSMEGNAIIDFGGNVFGDCVHPGETRFRTEPYELIDGYTELDQYFMGLRLASEVGPFWYVDEPTTPGGGASSESLRSTDAVNLVGACGKRVNLTVANIQAYPGVGPRVPAIGDEIDQDASGAPHADVKTMAFILLVQQGPPNSHASPTGQLDTIRRTWQAYGNGPATGGRGRFDTSLSPPVH